MSKQRIERSKEQIVEALNRTKTAAQASRVLGLSFATFKRRCSDHGIEFKTNQGARGTKKRSPTSKIPLEKIFSGDHYMVGNNLKHKLLAEGIVKNECAICKLPPIWNGKKLSLQLDHIDGDNVNNSRENLRLLCPNCHSQTDTFSKGKWKCHHGGIGRRVGPRSPCSQERESSSLSGGTKNRLSL